MEQSYQTEHSRYFPSSLPIRSPSPDTKNANKINKTISPVLQIKRQQMTPTIIKKYTEDVDYQRDQNQQIRSRLKQSQRNKINESIGMEVSRLKEKIAEKDRIISNLKYQTDKNNSNLNNSMWRQSSQDLRMKIMEKDRIITELKKVLASMSQSQKHRSIDLSYSGNQSQLKQKIKVLTIQNQKLGQMVRKLNRKGEKNQKQNLEKTIAQNKSLENKLEFLMMQNNQLQQKIQRFRRTQNEEIVELNRINNNLTIQLKSLSAIEEKTKILEKQNEKLIKLLKEQRDSQKNLTSNLFDQQLIKLQNQNKLLREKAGPEKITIVKIKQQYQENLKIFQERVNAQVNKKFQDMHTIIKNLEQKLNKIQAKKLFEHPQIKSKEYKEESPVVSKFITTTDKKVKQQPSQQQKTHIGIHEITTKPNLGQGFSKSHIKIQETQSRIKVEQGITPLTDQSKKSQIKKPQEQIRSQIQSQQKNRSHISSQQRIKSHISTFQILKQKQIIQSERSLLKNSIQSKYNQLVGEYNILRQQNGKLLQQIENLADENGNIRQQNDNLTNQISEQALSYNQELQQYKLDSEKRFNEEVNKLKAGSQSELRNIKQKYENQVQQLKKSTQQQINRLIDTYNQQIIMLRSAIQSKNKDINQINKQIQIIQNNHIQILNEKQLQLNNIKANLQKKEKDIKQFNEYRKSLEQQQSIRKRSYTELETKFAFLNDRIRTLTKQNEGLANEVQNLEDENQTIKYQLGNVKDENSMIPSLKQRIQSFEAELLKIQENLEQKKLEVQNLYRINNQLNEDNNNLNKLNNELQTQKNQVSNLVDEIQKINQSLGTNNLDESIQLLTQKINYYEQQMQNLTIRLTKSLQQQQSYKKKFIQVSQKVINLQNQIKIANANIQFLTQTNSIKEQECTKLKNLIDLYINSNEQSSVQKMVSERSKIELSQLNQFRAQYVEILQKLNRLIGQIKEIQSRKYV